MVASENEGRKAAPRYLVDVVGDLREAISPWIIDLAGLALTHQETDDREWSSRIVGKTAAQEIARNLRLLVPSSDRDDRFESRDVVARRLRREMFDTSAREQIVRLAEEVPAALDAARGDADAMLLVVGLRLREALRRGHADVAAQLEAVAGVCEVAASDQCVEAHCERDPSIVVDHLRMKSQATNVPASAHVESDAWWFDFAIDAACVFCSPEGAAVGKHLDTRRTAVEPHPVATLDDVRNVVAAAIEPIATGQTAFVSEVAELKRIVEERAAAPPSAEARSIPTGPLSTRDWATVFGVDEEVARARFGRWRKKNPLNGGCTTATEGGTRQARFLYSRAVAEALLRGKS